MKDFFKGEIIIKQNEDGADIAVEGSNIAVMAMLSALISSLRENSKLTESDIKEAVEIGFKDEEELEKYKENNEKNLEKDMKQAKQRLQKLLDEMFNL